MSILDRIREYFTREVVIEKEVEKEVEVFIEAPVVHVSVMKNRLKAEAEKLSKKEYRETFRQEEAERMAVDLEWRGEVLEVLEKILEALKNGR